MLRIKTSLYSDGDQINLRQVSVMRTNCIYSPKMKIMKIVLLDELSSLCKKTIKIKQAEMFKRIPQEFHCVGLIKFVELRFFKIKV